jgi:alpha-L-fucosidase
VEHLFNTSVCAGPDGLVMAYETNDPAWPPFTVKFARSRDLDRWEKVPGALFGADRYAACPCLRHVGGWYYMLYLEHRRPRHVFETWIARSRDLAAWELSAANPVLLAEGLDEGINASDPELVEVDGGTLLYFAVGDQLTWMKIKRAVFAGDLRQFCEAWFVEPGIPDRGAGPKP